MSQYNLNFKQKQYQNQPAKTKYLGYLHITKNDNKEINYSCNV